MPWFLTSVMSMKTIESLPPNRNIIKRTFGFYNAYHGAYKAIQDNIGNMRECLYDYLVLEYIEEGIHPAVHMTDWWQWSNSHNDWYFIGNSPEEFKGITNWALG